MFRPSLLACAAAFTAPVLAQGGADCSAPQPIAGLGTFDVSATTSSSGFAGGSPCAESWFLGSGGVNDVFYVWTAPANGHYTFDICGIPTGTVVAVHAGSDCSATCVASGETADCGTAASPVLVGNVFAGDTFLVQVGSPAAVVPPPDGDLVIANGPPGPTTSITCSPAVTHSGGTSATMANSYVWSGVLSGLHLEVTDGPPGQFGILIVSQTLGAGSPLSNGILCLDLPIARYDDNAGNNLDPAMNSLGVFDAAGTFQTLVGNSTVGSGFDVPEVVPQLPANPTIQIGETWYFQCWFRDLAIPPATGTAANLSDVVCVTF